ncbi:hypothetical protein AVEN_58306-1 [Araneus ventricosus]|uniref:Uncharacterized protein n=1 Tax=Araneus ventricosus TaxID=182803 RepID=A0A4Y2CQQ6_ARAVE|nr:hypothetical protein AVEN_58306-1 [Araneus ventricosus]
MENPDNQLFVFPKLNASNYSQWKVDGMVVLDSETEENELMLKIPSSTLNWMLIISRNRDMEIFLEKSM